MNLKLLIDDNRLRVAFTLFFVWLLAILHFKTINSIIYPLLAIASVSVSDLIITRLRHQKQYWPFSAIVSGFLIGLTIAPTESTWTIVAAGTFASLSKQFINTRLRQHIFNPAAFGIMATSLVLGVPVSWWAVSWSSWPILILVPAMVRILWPMKRLWLLLTFLGVSFVYILTLHGFSEAVLLLNDGTTMLFALVMLPEPITSPTVGYFKYCFGVLVAVMTILLSSTNFLGDIYLPALLISNLIGFLLIRFSKAFSQTNTAN